MTATRVIWEQGNATSTEERDLFDQGEISECEYEFGPHTDHSDCQRMLDTMHGDVDDGSGYADAVNRELEEKSLGRPLFPNEY